MQLEPVSKDRTDAEDRSVGIVVGIRRLLRDCEGKAGDQEGLGTVEGNRQGNHSLLMGIFTPG